MNVIQMNCSAYISLNLKNGWTDLANYDLANFVGDKAKYTPKEVVFYRVQ